MTIQRAQAQGVLPTVRRCSTASKRQAGLTLVELMIAMVIGLVITLAAFAALIVSQQGFKAVDTASQLRDNSRFTADLIQRLAVQTGYFDDRFVSNVKGNVAGGLSLEPNIKGLNNATKTAADFTLINPELAFASRGGSSVDGSDALILRFQSNETYPGSGVSDNSMIDCAGFPKTPSSNRSDRMASILYVAAGADGEPSLMCGYFDNAGNPLSPQPVIRGVETFQVLYGTDGVVANTAPSAALSVADVADRYLRADQLDVPGNASATNANWQRVRSLRIGLVIRGPIGSALETPATAPTFYPLGIARSAAGGADGSALSSTNDPGTQFTPPADNRLRQVVTITVQLRNPQAL